MAFLTAALAFGLAASIEGRGLLQGGGGGGAPRPSGGGRTSNSHVDFTAAHSCSGAACGPFELSAGDYLDSFAGFVAGSTSVSTINYYGAWFDANVGAGGDLATDGCATNPPTSTVQAYPGVTITSTDSEHTVAYSNTPSHDCENYCNLEGDSLPPLLTTTFTNSFTQTTPAALGTHIRTDISNVVGVAVNGVKIFSPYTGIGTVAPYDEKLDSCNGHPANGDYHYHGHSICIHGEGFQAAPTTHSLIYGWASDGFPIYGPYGFSDTADATSAITRVTSGYLCTSGGVACTTDTQRAIATNWAWAEGNGHLDDCNGHWTVTPDFPNGMYVYVLSLTAEGHVDFPGVPYCMQSSDGSTGTDTPAATPAPTAAATPAATPATTPATTPAAADFCALYTSTCVTPGHTAEYADCAATVDLNPDPAMVCRVEHLGRAVEGEPERHCTHAQEGAAGPCADETLNTAATPAPTAAPVAATAATPAPTAAPVAAATPAPTAAPVAAATPAPTAAPVAAATPAPTAAPVTVQATAKVDGLPDDFDTNDQALNDFAAGVATLASVPLSNVAITSATKITARRHLLASTFDIKYTVQDIPAAAATAVIAKLKDPAQVNAAIQATMLMLPKPTVTAASAAAAVPGDTSGAASVAASMVAGAIALSMLV